MNAGLDIRLRRFDHAREAIDRHLAVQPRSASGYFMRGEALRREAGSDRAQLEAALSAYETAARLDASVPEAQRELGLLERQLGRDDDARPHRARYLQLAPAAADRAIVESYLH